MLMIEDVISRFEEAAKRNEALAGAGMARETNLKYAKENRQMADWLKELVELRKERYLTDEEIAESIGSVTPISAYHWFQCIQAINLLGYAVVKRRTKTNEQND